VPATGQANRQLHEDRRHAARETSTAKAQAHLNSLIPPLGCLRIPSFERRPGVQVLRGMRLRGGAGTVNETSIGSLPTTAHGSDAGTPPADSAIDAIPCLALERAAVIGIEPFAVRIVRTALGLGNGRGKRRGFLLYGRRNGLLIFRMALADAKQSGEPHKRSLRKIAASLRRWLSLLRKDLNQCATLRAYRPTQFVKRLTQKNA
jgi:hypothetical protein